MSYDVIGDIHGHVDELRALLSRLGYVEHQRTYRHPERTAVFLGDFIDRGPAQLETLGIVRRMIDAGSAVSVMGNHELNAVAWFLEDEERPGEHLRPRSGEAGIKNRRQHEAFLHEVESNAALHRELVDWFLTLPLWLELDGIRVVHACWHPVHMERLGPSLARGRFLTAELMQQAARRGTSTYQSVEVLTKGLEVPLPDGASYTDKDGHVRKETRIKWWDPTAITFRDAALLNDDGSVPLPETPIPASARIEVVGEAPLFVGHYWLSGTPERRSHKVACVDYSAGKGGPLVAYRWNGGPAPKGARRVSPRG